jgi:hypothetical protein
MGQHYVLWTNYNAKDLNKWMFSQQMYSGIHDIMTMFIIYINQKVKEHLVTLKYSQYKLH